MFYNYITLVYSRNLESHTFMHDLSSFKFHWHSKYSDTGTLSPCKFFRRKYNVKVILPFVVNARFSIFPDRVSCSHICSEQDQFSSVQVSRSVMSDCLRHHGLQHARTLCPSPTPGTWSNSCPLCQ